MFLRSDNLGCLAVRLILRRVQQMQAGQLIVTCLPAWARRAYLDCRQLTLMPLNALFAMPSQMAASGTSNAL